MRARDAAFVLALMALPALGRTAPDLSQDSLLRDHLWREITALPAGRRPKVGLVLSAGSLRATAHVGVLAVLDSVDFPVDAVAGTSMGAVLGAMVAAEKPMATIWKVANSLKINSGNNLNTFRLLSLILSDKLLSSKKTEKLVQEVLGKTRFQDLPKPFACVAMDLYSGEGIILREGDLAAAVRASMNLPGIFAPVEYRHRYLVDGGVVDYIPVDAAKLLGAQWVLASVTEPDYTHSKPENVLESLEQVINIRGSLLSREQRRQANFLIEPPVGDIGMYETSRTKEAIAKGIVAAKKRLNPAMEEYILFSMPSLLPEYIPPRPAKNL
ncbi:MAG: patatin-like phospholipase family protein [Elusimicrobia bacterium]|nr:patatin-like phospholipase family protein [Elusimicrobiota bacterium]